MRARVDTPLRQEMRRQGRRNKWLAEQVGSDETQVSRWMSGLHEPVRETQERIATALGVDIATVFPALPAGSEAA